MASDGKSWCRNINDKTAKGVVSQRTLRKGSFTFRMRGCYNGGTVCYMYVKDNQSNVKVFLLEILNSDDKPFRFESRQFKTLEEFITHYKDNDLHVGCRLSQEVDQDDIDEYLNNTGISVKASKNDVSESYFFAIVKAKHDYKYPQAGDLWFEKEDLIEIIDSYKDSSGWLHGQHTGTLLRGQVPGNHIEVLLDQSAIEAATPNPLIGLRPSQELSSKSTDKHVSAANSGSAACSDHEYLLVFDTKKDKKVDNEMPKRLVKALYDYTNVYAGEVQFQKDDEMEVLDRAEEANGWTCVLHIKSGQKGWVPTSYTQLIVPTVAGDEYCTNEVSPGLLLSREAPESKYVNSAPGAPSLPPRAEPSPTYEIIVYDSGSQPPSGGAIPKKVPATKPPDPPSGIDEESKLTGWLPQANQVVAHSLLTKPNLEKGTFLTRPSTVANTRTLSVRPFGPKKTGEVQHYRIQNKNNKFFIDEKNKFNKLPDLIKHYQSTSSKEVCCKLTKPYTVVEGDASYGLLSMDEVKIPKSELKLGHELARGHFGIVYEATWTQSKKGLRVVVKELKLNRDNKRALDRAYADFESEAKIMHELRHPHLVQMIGICSDMQPFGIITEFMENGSLLEWVRSKKKKIPATKFIEMSSQVADGMEFLEQKNYIHRDLRAANVLVNKEEIVKVADFGLSKYMEESVYTGSEDSKFPWRWAAPEILDAMKFSSKSDVWSYGVLLWEMYTFGEVPFQKDIQFKFVLLTQLNNNKRLNKPENCSEECYDLMQDCWKKDPKSRPTFTVIKSRVDQLQ